MPRLRLPRPIAAATLVLGALAVPQVAAAQSLPQLVQWAVGYSARPRTGRPDHFQLLCRIDFGPTEWVDVYANPDYDRRVIGYGVCIDAEHNYRAVTYNT